jgi:hypothetical protein
MPDHDSFGLNLYNYGHSSPINTWHTAISSLSSTPPPAMWFAFEILTHAIVFCTFYSDGMVVM